MEHAPPLTWRFQAESHNQPAFAPMAILVLAATQFPACRGSAQVRNSSTVPRHYREGPLMGAGPSHLTDLRAGRLSAPAQ